MKITINVDCTPDEARAFMGLPDVGPLQAEMMDQMKERMQKAAAVMDPETMLKSLFPMSPDSMLDMQKAFWGRMASAGGEKTK